MKPDPDFSRRLGRFTISKQLIKQKPEVCIKALSGMLILEAAYSWEVDGIKYLAASDLFDVVDECVSAPAYEARFWVNEDGSVSLHGFERSRF